MNKPSAIEELKIMLTPEFIERFWSKVSVKGESECWEWQAALIGNKRYGVMKVGKKLRMPHRIAYSIHHRKIPVKLIRHSCNNSRCCNPKHLTEGTHTENMEDMFKALRHPAQREEKEIQLREAFQKLTLVEKELLYKVLIEEFNSSNTN